MTPAEKLLWKYLSDRGMVGVKFRRQHPIDRFIVDFYCSEHKLGIELDGGIHNNMKEHDLARQRILESKGIVILRFKNEEVFNSLDSVLKQIKRQLFPSPRSGEGWSD
jgi:very-short-patch-repair endonuclease